MSTFGADLIRSAKEAVSIAKGEAAPARAFVPDDIGVRAIRKKLGLNQVEFAQQFDLTYARVRDWEQGRSRTERLGRSSTSSTVTRCGATSALGGVRARRSDGRTALPRRRCGRNARVS